MPFPLHEFTASQVSEWLGFGRVVPGLDGAMVLTLAYQFGCDRDMLAALVVALGATSSEAAAVAQRAPTVLSDDAPDPDAQLERIQTLITKVATSMDLRNMNGDKGDNDNVDDDKENRCPGGNESNGSNSNKCPACDARDSSIGVFHPRGPWCFEVCRACADVVSYNPTHDTYDTYAPTTLPAGL